MNAEVLKAKDFMTTMVYNIELGMTVDEGMQFLVNKNISGAAVTNTNDIVFSIVSEFDLMKLSAAGLGDEKFLDILDKLPKDKQIIWVKKEATFVEVFKLFLNKKVRRVLVMDSSFKIHGIISRRDILSIFLKDKGMFVL